ncbi:dihydrodipicolinate reductase [Thermosyntropha lipolytica DSM 11003]|uniref:4-hydroxy-tetrahydrodipicolinate reductase n=1 Tax=Thermosyntropha lipolytica DSM 11003 TaxID=1123382 RepID=A0A1M5PWY5_9FIRM|nr:4-hydroxy-tetrahydrodipicolinate reductase [Thermosyntropha lipolytica]SHH06180.1 dihydrodipicolinate reductase [Thermosyntropha lipolytica DSM 11003]
MENKIRVIVAGALGKMGRETLKAVNADKELELVGAADVKFSDANMKEEGILAGLNIPCYPDLERLINEVKPDVMVDFTNPQAVFGNAKIALQNKITCVIGTTGLKDIELEQLEKLAYANETGVAVIPNFAIGAVLMMKFAREAAEYFSDVEIIELHHDQKMDAPSGTAIKTAELINERWGIRPPRAVRELEKIPGCRGGNLGNIRIHSVRLPGLVAHQEVIFGGPGQSLTIRHDSFDRAGFMPGVVMVIKKMAGRKGLVYGMENLL